MLLMRPMTAGEFHAYRTRAVDGYARDLVSSGQNAIDDAASRARACFDTLLPDGLLTPGQTLVQLIDTATGDTVGDLWYAIVAEGPNRTLFIYDLDIVPSRRRQRWATRARCARGRGAPSWRHGDRTVGVQSQHGCTCALSGVRLRTDHDHIAQAGRSGVAAGIPQRRLGVRIPFHSGRKRDASAMRSRNRGRNERRPGMPRPTDGSILICENARCASRSVWRC
jgi:hypothetical protein